MKLLPILISVLFVSPIYLDEPQRVHAEPGVYYEHVELAKEIKIKLPEPISEVQAINIAPAISTGPADLRAIVTAAALKHNLDPDWFWNLAECESTWTPTAVNTEYYENGHPSGLYQHLSGYWPGRAAAHGYAGASVFDPVANANVTAAMWASGSHLWECQ